MKILMLLPYLPYPPVGGGQARSYNLIKHLSKKHDITLFSLIKDPKEKKHVKEMLKYCKKVEVFQRPTRPWTLSNILRTGFSTYPFLVIRNFTDGVKAKAKKELESGDYELIHAENFYVMPFIPKTAVPIVMIDQTIWFNVYKHYVETMPWYKAFLKPIMLIDIVKLKYWEVKYWKSTDYIAAVSEEDRQIVSTLSGRKDVYMVPNGVDFDSVAKRKYAKSSEPLVLFGNADFHWMQNQEGAMILLNHIWPKIREQMPEAKLWITGKIAPVFLKNYLSEKEITIKEIPAGKTMEPYQRAWILIAPMLSGGGSRTKLFEAMAAGLAIVATNQGVEGIGVENGKQALTNDNFDELAKLAIKVLKNAKLRESLGANARDLVKSKFTWEASAAKLDELYSDIAK